MGLDLAYVVSYAYHHLSLACLVVSMPCEFIMEYQAVFETSRPLVDYSVRLSYWKVLNLNQRLFSQNQ